jgi:hypothetical protein
VATPLDAAGRPVPERPVRWSTETPDVASVDEDGTVAGLVPGEALIVVECDGWRAAARISVHAVAAATAVEAATVELSAPPDVVYAGQRFILSATARDAAGVTLTEPPHWTSSDPSVAMVFDGGLVATYRPGSVTITAAVGAGEGSVSLAVLPAELQRRSLGGRTHASLAGAAARRPRRRRFGLVAAGIVGIVGVAAGIVAALGGGEPDFAPREVAVRAPPAVPAPTPQPALGAAESLATSVDSMPASAAIAPRDSAPGATAAAEPDPAPEPPRRGAARPAPNRAAGTPPRPAPDAAVDSAVDSGIDSGTDPTARGVTAPPPVPPTIEVAAPESLPVGRAAQLSARVSGPDGAAPADGRVAWSSSDPMVASVDANTGALYAHRGGRVTVTASAGGATTSVEIAVVEPPPPPPPSVPAAARPDSASLRRAAVAALDACYEAVRDKSPTRMTELYDAATPDDAEKLEKLIRLFEHEEWKLAVGPMRVGPGQLGASVGTMDFTVPLSWRSSWGKRLSSSPVFRVRLRRAGDGWEAMSCRIVGSPRLS